jgi:hypothetical protein
MRKRENKEREREGEGGGGRKERGRKKEKGREGEIGEASLDALVGCAGWGLVCLVFGLLWRCRLHLSTRVYIREGTCSQRVHTRIARRLGGLWEEGCLGVFSIQYSVIVQPW